MVSGSCPSSPGRVCAWPLQAHILEFYEYLYTSTQSMDDLKLYQDLPPSLATRLAINVHRRVVSRAPFLYALSDDALLAVLARLSAVIYVPGQVRKRRDPHDNNPTTCVPLNPITRSPQPSPLTPPHPFNYNGITVLLKQ